MNRLTGFLVFFVLLATVVVPPLESSFTISPWAGLTTLAMDDVHRNLENRVPGTATNVVLEEFVTEASTGAPYMVGLDLASLRFAYLMPTSAKVTWEELGIQYSDEITTSFAMALIGLRVPHPTRAIMSLGIYGGYATTLDFTQTITYDAGGSGEEIYKIPGTGTGVVAEGIFAIQIWRLEINASYRYAVIPEILAERDVDIDGDSAYDNYALGEAQKGKPLRGTDGKILVYDFSGIMLTVGLRFGPGPKKSMEKLFREYGPWGYRQKRR